MGALAFGTNARPAGLRRFGAPRWLGDALRWLGNALTGDGFAFAGDAARGVRVDSGDGAIRPGGGAGHNVGRSPYWTRNHTQRSLR